VRLRFMLLFMAVASAGLIAGAAVTKMAWPLFFLFLALGAAIPLSRTDEPPDGETPAGEPPARD